MEYFQKPIDSLVYMPNYSGKKSWCNYVFGLMTPPEYGVSTNIGQNFAETLQFEVLAVKNFFFFITCIFLWKKSWIGGKCIFHDCLKGLKGTSSNTLKLFFLQNVFFALPFQYLWKMHLIPIQDFFHQKMRVIEKKELTFFKNYCSGTQLYLWIWSPFYLSHVISTSS